MADNFIDTPAEPEDDKLQIVAAVLLGLAAILTAMSGYYSAIYGGDSADTRADAGRVLADANFFYAQDAQLTAQDQAIFVPYAEALQSGDTELADYLTTLMRPEFAAAVEWWTTSDEAETPFDAVEGNPYYDEDGNTPAVAEAETLQTQADGMVEDAADLDAQGDQFDLATGILALTLFFGGIGTLFRSRRVAGAMLAMAGVGLAFGAFVAFTAFGVA
jgi:hypothetical protein